MIYVKWLDHMGDNSQLKREDVDKLNYATYESCGFFISEDDIALKICTHMIQYTDLVLYENTTVIVKSCIIERKEIQ